MEVNLQASAVALELLAWDRARVGPGIDPVDRARIDSLVERGAGCYRRLLMSLHGERESTSTAEAERWLGESFDERAGRASMTNRGFLARGRLKLNEEDLERLDRQQPHLSFSGSSEQPAATEGDVVAALERLSGLYRDGLLSDEEFAAAKARVVGR